MGLSRHRLCTTIPNHNSQLSVLKVVVMPLTQKLVLLISQLPDFGLLYVRLVDGGQEMVCVLPLIVESLLAGHCVSCNPKYAR